MWCWCWGWGWGRCCGCGCGVGVGAYWRDAAAAAAAAAFDPAGPIPLCEDGAASRRPARPPRPACVPCGRWAVNVMSLIMMALLGEYLCMRRELQDIPLFGSSARRKPSDSSF